MVDFLTLAQPGITELSPYQPGKPVEELERELGIADIIKLASNENPLGPSLAVTESISGLLGDLARYPDGSAILNHECSSTRSSGRKENTWHFQGSKKRSWP